MSLRVVFLPDAEQDLKELRHYLRQNFGPATWQSSYQHIKETIAQIREFPCAGSIPDELRELNFTQYQQRLAGMNRIIYEITPSLIYIHVICDTRRDLKQLLLRRLLAR